MAQPDRVSLQQLNFQFHHIHNFERLTATIKMTCCRAETELCKIVNHNIFFARSMDEGRFFMQRVFQQSTDIIPDYNKGRMEIRFHTMSTQRGNNALKKLCDVVT